MSLTLPFNNVLYVLPAQPQSCNIFGKRPGKRKCPRQRCKAGPPVVNIIEHRLRDYSTTLGKHCVSAGPDSKQLSEEVLCIEPCNMEGLSRITGTSVDYKSTIAYKAIGVSALTSPSARHTKHSTALPTKPIRCIRTNTLLDSRLRRLQNFPSLKKYNLPRAKLAFTQTKVCSGRTSFYTHSETVSQGKYCHRGGVTQSNPRMRVKSG